jgi:3-mercaptopyruvate sulfurtransferase SseA
MSREFPAVSPQELAGQLEAGPAPIVLDVLPQDIHELRHIPGSASACVYEVTFPDQVRAVTRDTGQRLVVYGAGGSDMSAAVAAKKLARMGFGDVGILKGGLDAWVEAGLPLRGEQPGEPLQDTAAAQTGAGVVLPEEDLPVDAGESRIEWVGRNANARHHGTVDIAEGELRVVDGQIAGSVVIDMTTITNLNLTDEPDLRTLLEAHLKSDDFFHTEAFPTARLTFASGQRIAEAAPGELNFLLDAQFTLRGATRPIDIPATVSVLDDGRVALQADFDLDRTQWGVIYGSGRFFRYLTWHLVFDPITIDCRIVAG